MKLEFNIDQEIDFLIKYNLSPNEFMFIRTLLILQNDGNQDYFSKYLQLMHSCNVGVNNTIDSLINKGVINKTYRPVGGTLDPNTIVINKPFTKKIYRCSFDMGRELFEVYPQFSVINNCTVAIRTVAKHFYSLEDFYFRYGKEIKWNPTIHKEIIELVSWAADNNIINCSLSSFVINHGWESIKALKEGGGNINYDSVKLL